MPYYVIGGNITISSAWVRGQGYLSNPFPPLASELQRYKYQRSIAFFCCIVIQEQRYLKMSVLWFLSATTEKCFPKTRISWSERVIIQGPMRARPRPKFRSLASCTAAEPAHFPARLGTLRKGAGQSYWGNAGSRTEWLWFTLTNPVHEPGS